MVKRSLLLFICLPFLLLAAQFTASVSRNSVALEERFTLNLTLKDASAQQSPSLESLRGSFVINSQQQSSQTMIMNGEVLTTVTWKISLTPLKEGQVMIPSMSIQTNQGLLATDSILIQVAPPAPIDPHSAEGDGISLSTQISKARPYKNEPFFYTVRMVSKHPLVNVKVDRLNLEDAIAESQGDPKIHKEIVNGMKVDVVDFKYLVTPLKTGLLQIPALYIDGEVAEPKVAQRRSFWDDDLNSFFAIPGFERLKSFKSASAPATIDVQPPQPTVQPWLPAKSLRLKEILDDSQTVKVGEPLIRTFEVEAEGIMASQLPSLASQQKKQEGFKVYADKPEMGSEVNGENIHSFRKEQYTLIPQEAGSLTLPEIEITWWNVDKHSKEIARFPAKTLEVLPGREAKKSALVRGDSQDELFASTPFKSTSRDPLLYGFILGLGLLLIGAIFWGIALQRKIMNLTESSEIKAAPLPIKTPTVKVFEKLEDPVIKTAGEGLKRKKEKLIDLNPT